MKKFTILTILLALVGCGEQAKVEAGEIDTTILDKCGLPIEAVVVFTTTWCGACQSLKGDMKSESVAYHEIDAEENRAQFDCVGGEFIPLLFVEGREINTSDDSELTAALSPYSNN